ncbi:hypothetical protein M5K25_007289 [Dendrobium thyrsiflorum]|uniref:Uncharacterized protein n=1 Tax=Dendrobium thyrsiflorum TaxID=117978 RepID=A0ABD0VKT7_DENTH
MELLKMVSSSFSFHDLYLLFLPTEFRICAFPFPTSCNGCRRLVVDFQHFLYHVAEIRYLSFDGGHSFFHRCLDLIHLPFKPFFQDYAFQLLARVEEDHNGVWDFSTIQNASRYLIKWIELKHLMVMSISNELKGSCIEQETSLVVIFFPQSANHGLHYIVLKGDFQGKRLPACKQNNQVLQEKQVLQQDLRFQPTIPYDCLSRRRKDSKRDKRDSPSSTHKISNRFLQLLSSSSSHQKQKAKP